MTGFDSESDRRDAIRRQIVDECVAYVHEKIGIHGVTQTPEERRYLEVTVARRLLNHPILNNMMRELLKRQELEAMSQMMRQEIADVEKEIDV